MAATAGIALALSARAEIPSANVVGYSTVDTGETYVMVGAGFTQVGQNGAALKIGALKGDFESGDQIQVPYVDDEGYIQFDVYTYETEDIDGVDVDGWYDGDDECVNDTLSLEPGVAAWFHPENGTKPITIAGEVGKTSITTVFDETYNMTSGAYPVPFNPNESRFVWNNFESGDQIQVAYVDDEGYIQFNVYMYETEDEDGVDVNGWYDGNDDYVDTAVALAGQGFWVAPQNVGTASVTETSPIAE